MKYAYRKFQSRNDPDPEIRARDCDGLSDCLNVSFRADNENQETNVKQIVNIEHGFDVMDHDELGCEKH